MYFWRIEALKSRLADRPLSDREVLPYVVISSGLCITMSYVPKTMANVWDGLGAVWHIALTVLATIYIYRQNGGMHGQHFLQRYVAVGFVVSIRWLPVFILSAVAFYGTLMGLGADTQKTHWYTFLFFALTETLLYWRLACHIKDLARRGTNA